LATQKILRDFLIAHQNKDITNAVPRPPDNIQLLAFLSAPLLVGEAVDAAVPLLVLLPLAAPLVVFADGAALVPAALLGVALGVSAVAFSTSTSPVATPAPALKAAGVMTLEYAGKRLKVNVSAPKVVNALPALLLNGSLPMVVGRLSGL
jgi:hypothetical protein